MVVEVDMVKEQMVEILQVEVEDILDMEVIKAEVEAGIIAMEVMVAEVEAVDMEMEEEMVYLLDLVEVVGLDKKEQMAFVLYNIIFKGLIRMNPNYTIFSAPFLETPL